MTKLLLWCSPNEAPPKGYITVYWAQYISEREQDLGHYSLPQIINENMDYWKPRYLAWLDEISKSPCGDTNLKDALLIRTGLSYWWMSIPSEYSFSPKSVSYSTLRLWAFVQIVNERNAEEIYVAGANSVLQGTLEAWCVKSEIRMFIISERDKTVPRTSTEGFSAQIKNSLPAIAVGLGHLVRQYFIYFRVNRNRVKFLGDSEASITIFDDLVHCDIEAAHRGQYKPHYWGSLTGVLEDSVFSVNWVHTDIRTSAVPTVKKARKVVADLNQGSKTSHHFLLQDLFSLKVLTQAITVYLRIRRITRKVDSSFSWFDPISNMDMSTLITSDLNSDFRGFGAARNALWIGLFGSLVGSLPSQESGIYLMENQPFELALLSAWKETPNGPILGFVHGPVREWDLRYALGCSPHDSVEDSYLPSPTQICANGPLAEHNLLANGLRPDILVGVEALRFEMGLATRLLRKSGKNSSHTGTQILVLGEYGSEMTCKQLELIKELTELVSDGTGITYRPHPGVTLGLEDLPYGVRLSTGRKIEFDLSECDVVIASSVSNASLDAYLNGLPLIIQADGRVLNGTPLPRGAEVVLCSSAIDIVNFIASIGEMSNLFMPIRDSVFYIEPSYPKWRALLHL